MSILFVVPCHGRINLTAACLRQLRCACDTLNEADLETSAIIVGNDESLAIARELGFGTVEQENDPLGRKWNDGFQLACDPEHNPRPADWIVPLGSDDWFDPDLFIEAEMPTPKEVLCFRQMAVVNEKGSMLSPLRITYTGGVGMRVYPRILFEELLWRPVEEDKQRGIDRSLLQRVKNVHRHAKVRYFDLHQYQFVDWKSKGNLNSYKDYQTYCWEKELSAPFDVLAECYPAESISEMRTAYEGA